MDSVAGQARAHSSVVALTWQARHQDRALEGRGEAVRIEKKVSKRAQRDALSFWTPCSAELSREKKFGSDERAGTWSREVTQEATSWFV